jgi:hypothetical protein
MTATIPAMETEEGVLPIERYKQEAVSRLLFLYTIFMVCPNILYTYFV